MARFRYSMQSILEIKLKMETQAKQEFSAAKAALDAEEACLARLKERKEEYLRQAAELLTGELDLQKVDEAHTAAYLMDGFIASQQDRVEAARDKLEAARARLTEVMKERKTHENLKEKAFAQFVAEENRREGKEVDELTSYVYGQRRSAAGKESAPV